MKRTYRQSTTKLHSAAEEASAAARVQNRFVATTATGNPAFDFNQAYHEIYCPACAEFLNVEPGDSLHLIDSRISRCCNCADGRGNGNPDNTKPSYGERVARILGLPSHSAKHCYDVGVIQKNRLIVRSVYANNRTQAAAFVRAAGYDPRDVNMVG